MECENCKKPAEITTRYTVAREIKKWKVEGYQSSTIYTRYQILECNHAYFCHHCYKRYNLYRLSISGFLGSIILSILLIWQLILFNIPIIVFYILIGLWFFSVVTNWLIINSIGKRIPLWIHIIRFFINIVVGCWFFLIFEGPLPWLTGIIILCLGVLSDFLMVYFILKNYQFLISDYAIYLNRKRFIKNYGKNIHFFNALNESDLKMEI